MLKAPAISLGKNMVKGTKVPQQPRQMSIAADDRLSYQQSIPRAWHVVSCPRHTSDRMICTMQLGRADWRCQLLGLGMHCRWHCDAHCSRAEPYKSVTQVSGQAVNARDASSDAKGISGDTR